MSPIKQDTFLVRPRDLSMVPLTLCIFENNIWVIDNTQTVSNFSQHRIDLRPTVNNKFNLFFVVHKQSNRPNGLSLFSVTGSLLEGSKSIYILTESIDADLIALLNKLLAIDKFKAKENELL